MTELNHRRGRRGSRNRHRGHNDTWRSLPNGVSKFRQQLAHGKRRQLVRKLLGVERADDIPGNTPKHVKYDYF